MQKQAELHKPKMPMKSYEINSYDSSRDMGFGPNKGHPRGFP